jgi:uncharacterized protein YuzE
MIEFSYEPETGMAYVTLSKVPIVETVDMDEFGIKVDIGVDGTVVGYEIEGS